MTRFSINPHTADMQPDPIPLSTENKLPDKQLLLPKKKPGHCQGHHLEGPDLIEDTGFKSQKGRNK